MKTIRQVKTVFIIFMAFVCCWSPYIVVLLYDTKDTLPLPLHLYASIPYVLLLLLRFFGKHPQMHIPRFRSYSRLGQSFRSAARKDAKRMVWDALYASLHVCPFLHFFFFFFRYGCSTCRSYYGLVQKFQDGSTKIGNIWFGSFDKFTPDTAGKYPAMDMRPLLPQWPWLRSYFRLVQSFRSAARKEATGSLGRSIPRTLCHCPCTCTPRCWHTCMPVSISQSTA